MPTYRKKPVEVHAFQWTGKNPFDVMRWAETIATGALDWRFNGDGTISIPTLEGMMTASAGDWIIRGVKGEFYPCKPDIFEATYEPAGAGVRCVCPMCEHHTSAREHGA